MKIPYLKNINRKKVLVVHDKPYIMLAGEAHNSSSSSLEYMDAVWEKAEKLGMNTLLLPVTWELIEPEEGNFDFTLVNGLIKQARARGKKLVFLWFGAWKNAQSYYAPEWVKTDLQRFKRAEIVKGEHLTRLECFHNMSYTTLSYLCEETKKADARAFEMLMSYIKEIDEKENTVIMVQVENETGIMGAAREQSDEADYLFSEDVPADFIQYMKSHTDIMAPDVCDAVKKGADTGSWKAVFGGVAEEIFSAYHIAGYVNHVAEKGKNIYPLPMTANCWLDKGQEAGTYPTGGPVSRMMEVWKYQAPHIDVLSPDIYVPDFCQICDEYTREDNPLFIPETAIHSYAGPRQVYVVGHYHALGYAPFGFEEMGEPIENPMAFLFGADTEDPAIKIPQDIEEYGWYSRTLQSMTPLLAERYGTSKLQAVICERKDENTMNFGRFGFKVLMDMPLISRKDGVCLLMQMAENEFFMVVNSCLFMPFSNDLEKPHVDILLLEEGCFEDGNWKRGRRLNGDEVMPIKCDKPALLRIKLFNYE